MRLQAPERGLLQQQVQESAQRRPPAGWSDWVASLAVHLRAAAFLPALPRPRASRAPVCCSSARLGPLAVRRPPAPVRPAMARVLRAQRTLGQPERR